jgi:hypothetical protein
MTFPKTTLFDYGNTLLHEPDFDFLRGEEALFRHIKSNLTAKAEEIFWSNATVGAVMPHAGKALEGSR